MKLRFRPGHARGLMRGDLPAVEGFRVLHLAGSGGFSDVYAAEDLGHARTVALKVFRSRSRDDRLRADDEADLGRRLAGCDGVVAPLGRTAATDGRPVLVLPWFDRGTAADLLPASRRVSHGEVARIVAEVGKGLQAVHGLHVLHRDVSPRNVLLSTELGAALADLGCARTINSTELPPDTEALTPGYAAPEADRDGAQTFASDVYGLAATAWALLTGEPPFGRPPPGEDLEGISAHEYRRATSPPPAQPLQLVGVPAAVVDALRGALDPDPTRRPSIRELAAAFAPASGHDDEPGGADPRRAPGAAQPDTAQPDAVQDPRDVQEATVLRRADAPDTSEPRHLVRTALIAVACFGTAFVAVSLLTGDGDGRPGRPAAATRTAPVLTAPTDLRVADDGDSLTLTWTPSVAPGVITLVYGGPDGAEPARLTAQPQDGRAVVPVDSRTADYCFHLQLIDGTDQVTSSRTCTSRARGV